MKRRAGTPPGKAASPTKQAKAAPKSKGRAAAAAPEPPSPKKKAKKGAQEEPDKKLSKAAAKRKAEEEEEKAQQQKLAAERARKAAEKAKKAAEEEAERVRKAAEEKAEAEERARMAAEEQAERARKAAEESLERRERTMMSAEEAEIRRQAAIAAARVEVGRVLASVHQQDALAAQEAACLAREKEAAKKDAEVAAAELRQALDDASAVSKAAEEAANKSRELKEASEAAHQAALSAAAAAALASKKADEIRERARAKQLEASSAENLADEKAKRAAAADQQEEDAARRKKDADAQMADNLKGFCKTFELNGQFTGKTEIVEAIQGFLDRVASEEEKLQRYLQEAAERRRAEAEATEAKRRKTAEVAEDRVPSDASEPAKDAQADICPSCSTAYGERALFCMFCGQKRVQARKEEPVQAVTEEARKEEHVQAVAEEVAADVVGETPETPEEPLRQNVSAVPEEPPAKVAEEEAASAVEATPDEPLRQVVREVPEQSHAKVAEEASQFSPPSGRRRSLLDALRQRGTLPVAGLTSPQRVAKEKAQEIDSKKEEADAKAEEMLPAASPAPAQEEKPQADEEGKTPVTPAEVAGRNEAPAEASRASEQVPAQSQPMAVDDPEEMPDQASEAEASNEPAHDAAKATAKDELPHQVAETEHHNGLCIPVDKAGMGNGQTQLEESEQPLDTAELKNEMEKPARPVLCMVNGKWETVYSPVAARQKDAVNIWGDDEPAAEVVSAARETPDEPMPQTVKEASEEPCVPVAKKDETKSPMLAPTPARAEASLTEVTEAEKIPAEASEFAATATERQKELRQNIIVKKEALEAKLPEMQAAREVQNADAARIAAAEEAARPIERQAKVDLTSATTEEKAYKEEAAQVQQVYDNFKELRDNPSGKMQTRCNALKKEAKNLGVAKEAADALPAILSKPKKKLTAKEKKVLATVDEALEEQTKAREALKMKAVAKVKRCEEAVATAAQGVKDRAEELSRSKATLDAKAQEIKAFQEAVTAAERELDNHEQLMTSKGLLRFSSSSQCCMICCDDFPVDETVMLGCGHGWYCKGCITRFVEARLDSGIAGDVPCLSCPATVPETDLVSVLPVKTILKLHARSIEQRAVASGAVPRACPTPNCPMRQAVDESDPASHRQKCLFCNRESCWLCGTQPYHEGVTCEEHREKTRAQRSEEEESFLQWMQATGTKQCPTCGMATSKENLEKQNEQRAECHKMLCRNCGTKFCFKCLAVLSDSYSCGCTRDAHGFIDPHTGKLVKHLKRGRAS
eukprot:TRINITY_DN6493_c0_g1_i2.p1 TRINITY_DN6493_c0_g1~~TRINITY_DN6493_c0_g1_i2.p1  ORF type:complete len:1273 (+),score=421.89 TRINITY_DN6493_c0_g1_i2:63-3881(+)